MQCEPLGMFQNSRLRLLQSAHHRECKPRVNHPTELMELYLYIYIYVYICEFAIQPVLTLDVPSTCQTTVHASDIARSTIDRSPNMDRGSRPHRCEKAWPLLRTAQIEKCNNNRPRGSAGAHFGVFSCLLGWTPKPTIWFGTGFLYLCGL